MKPTLIVIVALLLAACSPAASAPPTPPPPTEDPCREEMLLFVAYSDGVVPQLRDAFTTLVEGNPAIDPGAMKALLYIVKIESDMSLFGATPECAAVDLAQLTETAHLIGLLGEKHMAMVGGWKREQAAAQDAVLKAEVTLEKLRSVYQP